MCRVWVCVSVDDNGKNKQTINEKKLTKNLNE